MTSIVKPAEAPKWMTGILRQINNKFAAVAPTAGTVNIPVYKGTVVYGDYSYREYYNDQQPPTINGVNVTYDYSLPDPSYYPFSIAALRLEVSAAQQAQDSRFVSKYMMLFSDGVKWYSLMMGEQNQNGCEGNLGLWGPPPS